LAVGPVFDGASGPAGFDPTGELGFPVGPAIAGTLGVAVVGPTGELRFPVGPVLAGASGMADVGPTGELLAFERTRLPPRRSTLGSWDTDSDRQSPVSA
jgi:hypothetical protein